MKKGGGPSTHDPAGTSLFLVLLLLATLSVVSAGCGDRGEEEGMGLDSPRRPAAEIRIYGETEEPGALTPVFDVAVGPEGRVFASEPRFARVSVFQEDGEFLGNIGNPGDGPGEFRNPSAIRFRADTVTILDLASGLSLFTLDGEYIQRLSFELPAPPELGFPTLPAMLLQDGTVACLAPVGAGLIADGTITEQSWVKASRDGLLLDTLVVYSVEGEYSQVQLPGRGPTFMRQPTPWTDLFLAAPDGSAFLAVRRSAALEGTESTFHVFRIDLQGDTVLAKEFAYQPVPLTTALKDSLALDWAAPRRRSPGTGPPGYAAMIRDQFLWPAHLPTVSNAVAGPGGSVWLRRSPSVGDSVRWDLLDENLEPAGHTFLPASLELKWVSLTSAWGLGEGEEGEPRIVRFDLQ